MLITCIVPTHNRPDLIQEAVQSLLEEPLEDLEIIVVDDGSTEENYHKVKQSIGDKVRLLKNDNAQGPGAARNVGINKATGKYITFLDDDDLNVPGRIKAQAYLMQTTNADFVTCTRYYYTVGESKELRGVLTEQVKLDDMWYRNIIISVSPMITKDLIKRVKFDRSLVMGEDYDAWLRCLLLCNKTVNYKEPAIYYRRFSDGETSQRLRKVRGRFMILNKYRGIMPLKWQIHYIAITIIKLIIPDPHLFIFKAKNISSNNS